MRSLIDSRFDGFIRDLETLVNIDSGSHQPVGLRLVRDFLLDRFSRMGWWAEARDFDGGAVPCLEVRSPGAAKQAGRFDCLFLGHMDTVFGEGTAARRPFSVRDGKATGPGVCDMKAGLVTMLHVAEIVTLEDLAETLSVCMAFNSDEEVGSRASREWFEALAKQSARVLVFEPGRATGHRILHRKGGGGYEVRCHGRAAHAGAEPQKGANAILELAHQIIAVFGFAREELGTTVNATTVAGGTADNVIPDFAKASVDVRVSSVEEARRIEACFRRLPDTRTIPGVQVEVRGGISRMPMVPSEQTERLWDRIAGIGRDIGLDMKLASTGGCSDGNFTAALGIPTVDALGPIGGGAHSEDEYVALDSIVPNTLLICEILRAAAAGTLP